jgi:hypothetical protein
MVQRMLKAVSALALSILSWQVAAVPISYALIPIESWSDNILRGTITLNDGVLGPITGKDIMAWSFYDTDAVTDVGYYYISSEGEDAQAWCEGSNGCFLATSRRLFFDFGEHQSEFFASDVVQYAPDSADRFYVDFAGLNVGYNSVEWVGRSDNPIGSVSFPPVLRVIAVADGVAVPEPGTGLLFCIGVVGWFVASCRVARMRRLPSARTTPIEGLVKHPGSSGILS